jgi:hypothetical protein
MTDGDTESRSEVDKYKTWVAIVAVPIAALTIGACNSSGESQSYKDGWNYVAHSNQMNSQRWSTNQWLTPDQWKQECTTFTSTDPKGDDLGQWQQGCVDAGNAGATSFKGTDNTQS